ncbi:hypothetical protein [Deinococcus ficus]|uniref:hypothetical protein n=1 Tax=Deinococcus ficus TaxID=317577 RepID=UPI0012DCB033|nr:hypothetical protein [Deinococcus ficus]
MQDELMSKFTAAYNYLCELPGLRDHFWFAHPGETLHQLIDKGEATLPSDGLGPTQSYLPNSGVSPLLLVAPEEILSTKNSKERERIIWALNQTGYATYLGIAGRNVIFQIGRVFFGQPRLEVENDVMALNNRKKAIAYEERILRRLGVSAQRPRLEEQMFSQLNLFQHGLLPDSPANLHWLEKHLANGREDLDPNEVAKRIQHMRRALSQDSPLGYWPWQSRLSSLSPEQCPVIWPDGMISDEGIREFIYLRCSAYFQACKQSRRSPSKEGLAAFLDEALPPEPHPFANACGEDTWLFANANLP